MVHERGQHGGRQGYLLLERQVWLVGYAQV